MRYPIKLKTFQVVAEDILGYPACVTPRFAESILRSILSTLDDNQEHFILLSLNSKGKVIGYKVISSGTENSTLVNPSMVYRAALVLGGTSIVCAHNHPSGDPRPSEADENLTERLARSGDIIGIPLSDHIIIGFDSIYSFRNEGTL